MPEFLRKSLNQITMYRLMLYFLLVLLATATFLSLIKILPYDPLNILLGGVFLVAICNLANYLFSKLFKAKTNFESASITALILSLIVGPFSFFESWPILAFIGFAAMASKYVFAFKKKHIFNPAATAVFLSAIIFQTGASWWVGSIQLLPIIIVGGLLVLIKIERLELIASFLAVYFFTGLVGRGLSASLFLAPVIWFFVLVMLVEPLTSPSTKKRQMAFGAFVAIFYFGLQKFLPTFAYGLETSLLAGNIFSFFISPSFNLVLVLRKREKVAKDTWAFSFEPMSDFNFVPGQYLEWTYPHKNSDSKGVRRFFTISSSPEETYVMVTLRALTKKLSSFKKALLEMKQGEQIVASSPMGEFVLPEDKNIPLCFIAGGIGITPFRSMAKHLLEKGEKRDIVLLYSNRKKAEIAFEELFDEAEEVGVKTFNIITERDGYIDEKMIAEKVPDYRERAFYVSGPQPMVEAFKKMLSKMKVKSIETDFFPGYTDTHQK